MPTDRRDGHRPPRDGRGGRLDAVIVCAVLVICSAIVAGTAWSRPTTTAASLSYTQAGRLSYSAPTSPVSVYGSAGLTTGQPIYGSVLSAFTISYAYQFRAAASASLRGTEQLVATISNGQGITRTIPIQSAVTPFTGDRFTVSGTLDMAALSSAARALNQVGGTQANYGTYTVAISPSVTGHGRLGPAPLNASFSSPVSFSYSAGNLVPGGSSASSGTQGKLDFAPSSSGSVSLPSGKSATLFLGLSVFDARVGSLVVLLASLLLVGLAGWPLLRQATSDDEQARIAARYGSSLVQAEAVEAHPGVVVVQLGSFDGLLQVARRLECPILHWGDAGDVYAVVDSGTLYRYRTGSALGTDLARRPEGIRTPLVRSHLTETAQRSAASDLEATVIRRREPINHGE
jgi:hypothetical protein